LAGRLGQVAAEMVDPVAHAVRTAFGDDFRENGVRGRNSGWMTGQWPDFALVHRDPVGEKQVAEHRARQAYAKRPAPQHRASGEFVVAEEEERIDQREPTHNGRSLGRAWYEVINIAVSRTECLTDIGFTPERTYPARLRRA